MKTLNLITALATAALLASCQSAQTVCKDGEYCPKCKTAFVQMGPAGKTSGSLMKKMNCPACGTALSGCTVCK